MPTAVDSTSIREVLRAFRARRVRGPVSVVYPTDPDEAIFVLTYEDAGRIDESEITSELQSMLRRKVWVTSEGPAWEGRTKVLDAEEEKASASRRPGFVIVQTLDGYRWRLLLSGGRLAAESPPYRTKWGVMRAVNRVKSLVLSSE